MTAPDQDHNRHMANYCKEVNIQYDLKLQQERDTGITQVWLLDGGLKQHIYVPTRAHLTSRIYCD